MTRERRTRLFAWTGWFALANGMLGALIGLRYLLSYPFPDSMLAALYVGAAHLGHFISIAWLGLALVTIAVILIWPSRRLVTVLAVLAAGVAIGILLLDSNVYSQNRFHLDGLTIALFDNSTWLLAGMLCIVALAFECVVAATIWRWLERPARRVNGFYFAAAFVAVWLGGQAIHVWADAVYFVPVTQFTGVLPVYYPMKAKRLLDRAGLVDPDVARARRAANPLRDARSGGLLNYPLEPLKCSPPDKRLSVLLVMFDALRPDAIDPLLMPAVAAFREEALDYRAHYSGGNSTRMGLFTMFYGLPSTYWQDFSKIQRPPVLIDEMQRQNYALALFSAAGFGSPALLDRTVFAGVSGIPVAHPEGDALSINRAVTDDWSRWLESNPPAQPFFGFLHYDPPAAALATDWHPEVNVTLPAGISEEGIDRLTQYRRGMRWLDDEFGRVLGTLEKSGLSESTLVILASDHGYEFDEFGLGYIGHASNFGQYQLRSTLMMRWPDRAPAAIERRTSHYSLPATLLTDVLGCSNSPKTYSSAATLREAPAWDWIIAGSYNAHAIVEPDRVTVLNPGGLPNVLGPDYRASPTLKAEPDLLRKAMLEMRRFYR